MWSLTLLAQLALPAANRPSPPVLDFPRAALDDTAAYAGYHTRLYRDGARNTLQVYLNRSEGRVVHLLANAENESVGFSIRDTLGRPAQVDFNGGSAFVGASPRWRVFRYTLQAPSSVELGWFLLGSMRVERDFQYWGKHKAPFADPPFVLDENTRLASALARLTRSHQTDHLRQLNARSVEALQRRFAPATTAGRAGSMWTFTVVQPTLDGRDTLVLRVATPIKSVRATQRERNLRLTSVSGDTIHITLTIATTGRTLRPLSRGEIFSADFLHYLANIERQAATLDERSPQAVAAARTLRLARGVELLASRDKLMAGLPTYATYFGRDMLVSALMMRSIWRGEMAEFVIDAALRKLAPDGQVSHEESLGGQAAREASSEYVALVSRALDTANAPARDALLDRAKLLLRHARRTREAYHMVDDELQLPVVVARWIADPTLSAQRKRAYLMGRLPSGEQRFEKILHEFEVVARLTSSYAIDPRPENLIGFPPRQPDGWVSASWRDSGAGYAGGRFAMDVNVIWAPHALASIRDVVAACRRFALPVDKALSAAPTVTRLVQSEAAARVAIERFQNAASAFTVRYSPSEIAARVQQRLQTLPQGERAIWDKSLGPPSGDSLEFLAVSLDGHGHPIPVANTDPATALFLGEAAIAANDTARTLQRLVRDVELFRRPYPVGLLVPNVGPAVVNDAYATPAVWKAFDEDPYHGPRVVWGREVNLFLLGAAEWLQRLTSPAYTRSQSPAIIGARDALRRELALAIHDVRRAVDATGFHSELWSYAFRDGAIRATRYGSGADVQLWSTTALAVEYAITRAEKAAQR